MNDAVIETETKAVTPLNDKKIVRSWYMYDWANSVYSLVITTAIFPIYYNGITKGTAAVKGSDILFLGFTINSSVLYSYTLSLSFLLVALILPLLSGAADYSGNKKTFMKFFVWLGGLSCMGLFFFKDLSTVELGLAFSMLASIGYSGSLVFYDAFLPEIVTEDRYDKTSARGYSMGYYGSVILMVLCVVFIMNADAFGFVNEQGGPDKTMATRISFLLVGIWWIGFAMIPFYYLPNNPFNKKPEGNIWTKGYEEIAKVWQSLKHLPDLKRYLLAFFFFNMGVQTVMYLATLFGTDELKLADDDLIATVVVIQLVGAVGAGVFSWMSKKRGNRFTLTVMITIWIGICVTAYFIQTAMHFYVIATVVGLVMGGIQSLSRATYSKLIPPDTEDHASYFSFYDVTWNLSVVIGTFSYGFIFQWTESMRYSALALGGYFVIGLLILATVQSKKIRTAYSN